MKLPVRLTMSVRSRAINPEWLLYWQYANGAITSVSYKTLYPTGIVRTPEMFLD